MLAAHSTLPDGSQQKRGRGCPRCPHWLHSGAAWGPSQQRTASREEERRAGTSWHTGWLPGTEWGSDWQRKNARGGAPARSTAAHSRTSAKFQHLSRERSLRAFPAEKLNGCPRSSGWGEGCVVGGSFRNSLGLVVNPLTLRLDPAGGEWSPHSAALEGSFQKNEEPFPKAGCWGCCWGEANGTWAWGAGGVINLEISVK